MSINAQACGHLRRDVSVQAAVTIPAVKAETRALVEAEAAKRTETAINEVSSDAEKARFMRRYCRDLGRLYDFETNKCRDARAARSIAGTSLIGQKGATLADQDAIDDTAAGKCGAKAWTPSECARHGLEQLATQ